MDFLFDALLGLYPFLEAALQDSSGCCWLGFGHDLMSPTVTKPLLRECKG